MTEPLSGDLESLRISAMRSWRKNSSRRSSAELGAEMGIAPSPLAAAAAAKAASTGGTLTLASGDGGSSGGDAVDAAASAPLPVTAAFGRSSQRSA